MLRSMISVSITSEEDKLMVSAKNAKAMITANAMMNKQKGFKNGLSRIHPLKGKEHPVKRIRERQSLI